MGTPEPEVIRMEPESTVFVVDDDPAMRESLRWLIESVEIPVETYESAKAFLGAYAPSRGGCLLLDVRMPGMSGIELHEELLTRRIRLPVIIITAYAEVSMAVTALKSGAVDFIEKPFSAQHLLDRVRFALERDRQQRLADAQRLDLDNRFASLTPREREVMELVVRGKSNKLTAAALGLSPKTVEVHRSKVMEKMKVKSLAELVRLVLSRETDDGDDES